MKETSLFFSFFLLIQQALERQRTAEKERLFLVYAKQWWREFLEIRPSHQSKMVKIFAQVCVYLCGAGANRNVNNNQTSACISVELCHYLAVSIHRMRTASTARCVLTYVSSGQAGCWRALDTRRALSAFLPTRGLRWWEEEANRSSGAH